MDSTGLKHVARPDSEVLVLGTLPGPTSLATREYYAHPRNTFWAVMGHLLGFSPALPYEERTDALLDHRIALWDVCESAYRPGALDQAIRDPVPNDFGAFYQSHPLIETVYFNGLKAERLYRRYVLPGLSIGTRTLRYLKLPSTSPAHAAKTFQQKCAAWAVVLGQTSPTSDGGWNA